LGRCVGSDCIGETSARELCLVSSITLGKLETVQRTAIKMTFRKHDTQKG